MDIYLGTEIIRTIRLFFRWLGDPYLIQYWKVIEAYHWPRWTNHRSKGWALCPDIYINFSFRKHDVPFLWFAAFREEMIEKKMKRDLIYVEVM